MKSQEMTSMQRTLTALGHQEPDRVPLFLLFSLTGAKFANTSIEDYFTAPERVAKAQLDMQARYQHDSLYGFFYASAELEAFGGGTLFFLDGPPNADAPPIRTAQDIARLSVPEPEEVPVLQRILQALRLMKAEVAERMPIIGVAISPFSLPVMQLGFERYFNLMLEDPTHFDKLIAVNEAFCVKWSNAQLAAGATAICYFDPISSSTIVTREQYLQTGYQIAKRTIAQINGPTATHMASGKCLPVLADIASTGTAVVGVSSQEDMTALKAIARGKVSLLGNLNGIEMRRWSAQQATDIVKTAIFKAGAGGGLLLGDNHGEIPWQVPDEVLMAISEAAHEWGVYPLKSD
ncbi:uroporphyrinogen decarboxylase family protein [Candidatus Venteria ishoeyi]|uniref:Uroporphyrinogen decarboxylase n=1 Tax=Candidatus Venteria ishoeyi TaxID=1899563 RepID=A0A1H6FBK4_9GAMM|nr:uroporphyrinogen decarboxylase family protein [Candidatus Venteria ishoeyi]SEH06761.1 Uroporphyrinogen decarboxylase [Candidatus Venteria ishoeyi]